MWILSIVENDIITRQNIRQDALLILFIRQSRRRRRVGARRRVVRSGAQEAKSDWRRRSLLTDNSQILWQLRYLGCGVNISGRSGHSLIFCWYSKLGMLCQIIFILYAFLHSPSLPSFKSRGILLQTFLHSHYLHSLSHHLSENR